MSRVFFTRGIVCLRMATSGSEDRVLKLVIWWIYEKRWTKIANGIWHKIGGYVNSIRVINGFLFSNYVVARYLDNTVLNNSNYFYYK